VDSAFLDRPRCPNLIHTLHQLSLLATRGSSLSLLPIPLLSRVSGALSGPPAPPLDPPHHRHPAGPTPLLPSHCSRPFHPPKLANFRRKTFMGQRPTKIISKPTKVSVFSVVHVSIVFYKIISRCI
jgi:hypothetical protein